MQEADERSRPSSSEQSNPVFPGRSDHSAVPGAPPYQYVVVRKTGSKGVAVVQACHAVGEACVYGPATESTYIVALVANRGEHLKNLSTELSKAGITHALIMEPDPPYGGRATALATAPGDRSVLAPFFAKFRVLR